MKKLIATILISAAMSLPLQADTSESLRFSLQHRINGGDPLPIETIEIPFKQIENNPLILLTVLKENFSKHVENREKPLQIDTKLEFSTTQALGKLPTTSIKTQIDNDGFGKSDLIFPAFRRVVPEKGLIDWKGLNLHFTFTDQNMTVKLNLAGLLFEKDEGKISALLGNTTINGQFDANSMPTQMDLNLSQFKIRDNDNRLNLNDFSLNFHSHQSAKGLQLGELSFKIGHSDLSQDNFQVSLDGFGIKLEGEEAQDSVINYNWHSQIEKFVFPTPLGIGKMAWISYAEKSAVRHLDEGALLDLQTTARNLHSQNNKPINIGFIMLDKLMAVLLAGSPEIATELNVKTPIGNLQANASVSINGKPTSLALSVLKSALQAELTLNINKTLLKEIVANQIFETMLKDFDDERLSEDDLALLKQQAKSASEQQILMFVGIKWLVETEDGKYQLVAALKNNQLIVNGMKIPLPF
ncbi:hypothetical protein PN36_10770 [Candidatus Thiomargarita nelsonii]|uniref:Secreted protein containing DUF945, bacterial n=1 Tax=Candidatus Thiomargarita nelsonii TaxID=1003181 RepID=A0A0A6P4W0_9GAMM|nr:hypothetical protein PN36_10770 [Candidatus Thiomargarita nelsonii]